LLKDLTSKAQAYSIPTRQRVWCNTNFYTLGRSLTELIYTANLAAAATTAVGLHGSIQNPRKVRSREVLAIEAALCLKNAAWQEQPFKLNLALASTLAQLA